MSRPSEYPFDPWHPLAKAGQSTRNGWVGSERVEFVGAHRTIPETDMQALMVAAPHVEPERSVEATCVRRERIMEAIDSLEPQLRWIWEAHVIREMSFVKIGAELGISKSAVHRLWQEAQGILQNELKEMVQ